MLAYLKYQWSLGEDSKRREAFIRLQVLYVFIKLLGKQINGGKLGINGHYSTQQ